MTNDDKGIGYYTEQLKQQASAVATQAGQEAQRVVSDVWQQGNTLLDDRKRQAAQRVAGVAEVLHSSAQRLAEQDQQLSAHYLHQAAAGLERFAQGLTDQDVSALTRQVEQFIRRRPGIFLGGAVLAGFLLARFLKSSAQRRAIDRPRIPTRAFRPDPLTGAPGTVATAGRSPVTTSTTTRPAFLDSADPLTGALGTPPPASQVQPDREQTSASARFPDPLTGAPNALEGVSSRGGNTAQSAQTPLVRSADPLTGAPDTLTGPKGERL